MQVNKAIPSYGCYCPPAGLWKQRIGREESNIVEKLTIKLLKSLRIFSEARDAKRFVTRYTPWYIIHRKRAERFYSQFIRPGDLCFDVGANIGRRTEVFLKLGARCVCVEPQRFCLHRLHKAFGNNSAVSIVGKALGDTEGEAEMAVCEDAPSISTMSRRWKNESRFSRDHGWKTTQRVAITTLDALIAQYGVPVFCKIDVEGYEASVLRGLTSPIPFLSFEFTGEFLDEAEQCIRHVLSIGPAEFSFSAGESMKLISPSWMMPDELLSTIASPSNKSLQGDIYVRFT